MFIFEWSATMGLSDKKYKLENKNDLYKFDMTFEGQLVENSADAFDVANTIIAISSATQEAIRIKYGEETTKQVSLNINAFKEGSLKTQFLLIFLADASNNLRLISSGGLTAYRAGKEALGIIHDYKKVKSWLKGRRPTKVEASPTGDTYNIHLDNSHLTINQASFKALQDKSFQKYMEKAVEPLNKEGSELESLSITDNSKDEPIKISRVEAQYIKRGGEEIQKIDELRLKGVITKIDTKVRSGYLNLGSMTSKRIPFIYPKSLPKDEFEILISSLDSQVQIYLEGGVDMDMEGKPCSIDVTKVQEDKKLL